MTEALIQEHIQRSIEAKRKLADAPQVALLQQAADLCIGALRQGNKVLLAGNGGSAADAQHIAAELVGRYRQERPALPAIALTTDTSALTAIGNDYGYERIFSRQLEALSKPGDVFIGISTSGNSANILAATDTAHELGVKVVGLTGHGGALADRADVVLCVESTYTATIQECHIMLGHILCALIETTLFE